MPCRKFLLDEITSSFQFLTDQFCFEFSSFEYSESCFGNFIATYSPVKRSMNAYSIIIQMALDRSQLFVYVSSTKKPKQCYYLGDIIKLLKSDDAGNHIPSERCLYWDEIKWDTNLSWISGQLSLASNQMKSIINLLLNLFTEANYMQTAKKLNINDK